MHYIQELFLPNKMPESSNDPFAKTQYLKPNT